MKNIVKCIIIICCLVFVFAAIGKVGFFKNRKLKNYEDVLGIAELRKGNVVPLKKTEIDGYIYKYYEDICLVFRNSGAYVRAEIIGDKYRLDENITVGSERDLVERTFVEKEKIRDLPHNQFGFIEDDIWVHFHYDESNKVEKISIYSFGP